jgi:hypothetical protein
VSRQARLGAGALVALLLLGMLAGMASPGFPVGAVSAAVGRAVTGVLGGGRAPAPAPATVPAGPHIGASDAALADIPAQYLGLYVTGARTCPALSWQLLAGIGKVESDHGRSPAPGVRSGLNRAGCCAGPMQFNLTNGPPSTWQTYGDGHPHHVYQPTFAIPAAARKLCNDGLAAPHAVARDPCPHVLGSPAVHQALKRYNNACWYVHEVITLATRYTTTSGGGGGGLAASADPFVRALARNPRITTTTRRGCNPRPDLASGRLDLRVQSLLSVLAERHRIRLSCLHSGHSRYVAGTSRVSNHAVWRAVDIDRVDGQAVSPASPAARALVGWLDALQGPLRPSEIGSPFPLGHRPHFSDNGHQHHIHIGYGQLLGA